MLPPSRKLARKVRLKGAEVHQSGGAEFIRTECRSVWWAPNPVQTYVEDTSKVPESCIQTHVEIQIEMKTERRGIRKYSVRPNQSANKNTLI